MKNIRMVMVVGAALGIGSAAPVFAEDSGWYLGGNYGRSEATIDEMSIRENLLDSGFSTTRFSSNESDLGFKLFGGYQFNRYFAIEGGYFDLGSFDFRAETDPPGALDGTIDIDGFNLDILGILPLGERFSLFARVGANHAEAQARFSGSGAVNVIAPESSEQDTNYKVGIGAGWAVSQRVDLRLEAERYRIDDSFDNRADIDLFSLGMVFRLGKGSPGERPARAKAVIVPVVVPAPPVVDGYCNILDLQFEVKGDDIQRHDEEKLQVLASYLKKHRDTNAVIEGHTDSVGDARDNMRLSQRRADSVRNYLINSHGIARSRLGAVGYGESRPLVDEDSEAARRQNRRIGVVIACVREIQGLEQLPARITMAMQIEFDRNRADIGSQYHGGLRDVARFMRANPAIIAMVEGHSDNATPAASREISLRRAQNVVNYLANDLGIARSRLSAVGFGETRRYAYNTTAEGRQENRRVNIILQYPDREGTGI